MKKSDSFRAPSGERILDAINSPSDLKWLQEENLHQLAQEIRDELITVLSQTGGHLGPNLGVVELTIALHYVFNTPKDKLVFDVSHQGYVHKLLTGRRSSVQYDPAIPGAERIFTSHRKRTRLLRRRPRRHRALRGIGNGCRPGSSRRERKCRGRRRGRGIHLRDKLRSTQQCS